MDHQAAGKRIWCVINRRSRRPEKTSTTWGLVRPWLSRGATRTHSTLGPGTRWDGEADPRHTPRTAGPIPPNPVHPQEAATKCERSSATPGRVLTNADVPQPGTPEAMARRCLGDTPDPDWESSLRTAFGTPGRRGRVRPPPEPQRLEIAPRVAAGHAQHLERLLVVPGSGGQLLGCHRRHLQVSSPTPPKVEGEGAPSRAATSIE